MKLMYCPSCYDVVQLRRKYRTCECGRVSGRYINNIEAEISADAISIAIGNGSFLQAIENMRELRAATNDQANRKDYQRFAQIEYAWVRPNEGLGNPHCKMIKEDHESKNQ